MMIKKILLLFCLNLILPVYAQEGLSEYQDEIFSMPVEEEAVYIYERGEYTTNPYSVYQGEQYSQMLKGGVQENNNSNQPLKDSEIVLKPKNPKMGKVFIGNIPASGVSRGVIGAYSIYKKDRFGIRNEYSKNMFKEEFTRNNIVISPEYALSKNLTVRAYRGQTAQRKGYEDGVALEYALNNSKIKSQKIKNLRFELNAANAVNAKNESSQRFGFNTRYNF